jgi:gamma-glutamyltranspeptidase/glutathione hydrolase
MHWKSALNLCLLVSTAAATAAAPSTTLPIIRGSAIFQPVEGKQGMVVASESLAAAIGLEVLRDGGNAVDAAVATGFALAVTLPRAGNLGGGGFMLIHDAARGQTTALDYRETAPASAHRDMFLNAAGEADPELSRYSAHSVGVPGTVAGLLEAHTRYGSLPLYRLLSPAVTLAREGFPVTPALARGLRIMEESGRFNAAARSIFFDAEGRALEAGAMLRQPDLADSLDRIRELGKAGFYKGRTAERIIATLQAGEGGMTLEDLMQYEPVWRKPVSGQFRGYEVLSMPPPSSGGVHLVQMLQMLEPFPLADWGHNSARTVHLLTEVMKRAYADRSEYLGDPDFVDVPQQALLSTSYRDLLISQLRLDGPTPSAAIRPGDLPPPESPQTTHFSIIDGQGNAVSNTYTLNFTFGSGIMAEGTGILLNNEMDDFSAKPGVPNAFGLLGGEANAVAPRKRMLSSMSPTIMLKDGQVRIVTGSPGGSRIINTVLQVALNVMEFGLNAAEAVNAPRFHHQWWPDVLSMERGFPTDTRRLLLEMGHAIETDRTIGTAQTILRDDDGRLSGAADPRAIDGAALAF